MPGAKACGESPLEAPGVGELPDGMRLAEVQRTSDHGVLTLRLKLWGLRQTRSDSYLGDDNDPWELRRVLREEPEWLDNDVISSTVIGLIDRRRAELQEATRPLALWVLGESPDDLVARYRSYWQAWHTEPNGMHATDPVILPGQ